MRILYLLTNKIAIVYALIGVLGVVISLFVLLKMRKIKPVNTLFQTKRT